jgi:hypothetical protein
MHINQQLTSGLVMVFTKQPYCITCFHPVHVLQAKKTRSYKSISEILKPEVVAKFLAARTKLPAADLMKEVTSTPKNKELSPQMEKR